MKINYVIARYWPTSPKQLGAYMYHNQIVFYGTYEEAVALANKTSKNTGQDYFVFELVLK